MDSSLAESNYPAIVGFGLTAIGVVMPFLFAYGLGPLSFLPLLIGIGFAMKGFQRARRGARHKNWAIAAFLIAGLFAVLMIYIMAGVRISSPVSPR